MQKRENLMSQNTTVETAVFWLTKMLFSFENSRWFVTYVRIHTVFSLVGYRYYILSTGNPLNLYMDMKIEQNVKTY